MTRKIFISLLLGGILGAVFFSNSFCMADVALNLTSPTDREIDVAVDSYFQWNPGPASVVKYVLDIAQFTQSEDNIPTTICLGDVCSFGFLDLTVGNINYLSEYAWKITAYNAAGNPVASSPEYSFKTEQAPEGPRPNGGGPNGGGPNGNGGSGVLLNPLKAKDLEGAIDSLINILFILAMAIGPLLVIYAAFIMLTAGGDATKVNKAKQILLWTFIAIAIVLLAKGLPAAVKGILGG